MKAPVPKYSLSDQEGGDSLVHLGDNDDEWKTAVKGPGKRLGIGGVLKRKRAGVIKDDSDSDLDIFHVGNNIKAEKLLPRTAQVKGRGRVPQVKGGDLVSKKVTDDDLEVDVLSVDENNVPLVRLDCVVTISGGNKIKCEVETGADTGKRSDGLEGSRHGSDNIGGSRHSDMNGEVDRDDASPTLMAYDDDDAYNAETQEFLSRENKTNEGNEASTSAQLEGGFCRQEGQRLGNNEINRDTNASPQESLSNGLDAAGSQADPKNKEHAQDGSCSVDSTTIPILRRLRQNRRTKTAAISTPAISIQGAVSSSEAQRTPQDDSTKGKGHTHSTTKSSNEKRLGTDDEETASTSDNASVAVRTEVVTEADNVETSEASNASLHPDNDSHAAPSNSQRTSADKESSDGEASKVLVSHPKSQALLGDEGRSEGDKRRSALAENISGNRDPNESLQANPEEARPTGDTVGTSGRSSQEGRPTGDTVGTSEGSSQAVLRDGQRSEDNVSSNADNAAATSMTSISKSRTQSPVGNITSNSDASEASKRQPERTQHRKSPTDNVSSMPSRKKPVPDGEQGDSDHEAGVSSSKETTPQKRPTGLRRTEFVERYPGSSTEEARYKHWLKTVGESAPVEGQVAPPPPQNAADEDGEALKRAILQACSDVLPPSRFDGGNVSASDIPSNQDESRDDRRDAASDAPEEEGAGSNKTQHVSSSLVTTRKQTRTQRQAADEQSTQTSDGDVASSSGRRPMIQGTGDRTEGNETSNVASTSGKPARIRGAGNQTVTETSNVASTSGGSDSSGALGSLSRRKLAATKCNERYLRQQSGVASSSDDQTTNSSARSVTSDHEPESSSSTSSSSRVGGAQIDEAVESSGLESDASGVAFRSGVGIKPPVSGADGASGIGSSDGNKIQVRTSEESAGPSEIGSSDGGLRRKRTKAHNQPGIGSSEGGGAKTRNRTDESDTTSGIGSSNTGVRTIRKTEDHSVQSGVGSSDSGDRPARKRTTVLSASGGVGSSEGHPRTSRIEEGSSESGIGSSDKRLIRTSRMEQEGSGQSGIGSSDRRVRTVKTEEDSSGQAGIGSSDRAQRVPRTGSPVQTGIGSSDKRLRTSRMAEDEGSGQTGIGSSDRAQRTSRIGDPVQTGVGSSDRAQRAARMRDSVQTGVGSSEGGVAVSGVLSSGRQAGIGSSDEAVAPGDEGKSTVRKRKKMKYGKKKYLCI